MCFGIRCSTQRADVITPSQPSFCTPGRPPRNLSVTSLPRPALRNLRPSISMRAVRSTRARSGLSRPSFQVSSKLRDRGLVNLAAVVSEARDFEPVAVGIDHAPPGEIVDRGAPQHRLLAAGVHRDVAADAGSIRGSRIDGEHQARALGGFGHATRHHAGSSEDRRHRLGQLRRATIVLDRAERFQLLGVDDRRQRRERNRAAGVARAAAARNDGQPQLDARAHQRRNFDLGVRRRAPRTDTRRASRSRPSRARRARTRRSGCCRRACAVRAAGARACAAARCESNSLGERVHALASRLQQLADLAIALDIRRVAPPLRLRSGGDAAPRSAAGAAAGSR